MIDYFKLTPNTKPTNTQAKIVRINIITNNAGCMRISS